MWFEIQIRTLEATFSKYETQYIVVQASRANYVDETWEGLIDILDINISYWGLIWDSKWYVKLYDST